MNAADEKSVSRRHAVLGAAAFTAGLAASPQRATPRSTNDAYNKLLDRYLRRGERA